MSQPSARILIVEDDESLRLVLGDNLTSEGYHVECVRLGREALEALRDKAFDLVVLDLMLPDLDGYSVCRKIREQGRTPAVLMLTARTLEEDLVRGFAAGADDYLGKPYRLRELLARVKALLRRNDAAPIGPIPFGGFRLDPAARELTNPSGGAVDLTRTEFDLLLCLVSERGRAFTRDEFMDRVWGVDVHVDHRTIDNFVLSLRKKLASAGGGVSIATVRGVGYRLLADPR
ncbi:MAG: response regulator transcription factor [Thermoanaerobaculia bacterium]